MKPKISVIHTDKVTLELIKTFLKDDFEVIGKPDRKTGIKMLRENPDTQLVITNIGKTGKGLATYSEMKVINKDIKVLFVGADENDKARLVDIIENEKKTNLNIIFQLDILSSFDSASLKKKINFLLALRI